ncbi:hypothetical protein ACWD1Y_23765 [Streptomyces sp. NPDC002814]
MTPEQEPRPNPLADAVGDLSDAQVRRLAALLWLDDRRTAAADDDD